MKLTKFKSVSLSLAIMMSISSVSFAQSSKKISPKDMAEKKTEIMKESLDLTKKQTKQVYEINLNYFNSKKGTFAQRPSLPKDGKHFKGAICQPNPEAPGVVECEKPKPDCKSVSPDGRPIKKGDCTKQPCPQMKPEFGKQKCDSSQMRCKPNQTKGCPPHHKSMRPDSLTYKYHKEMKEVLTASQYEKWIMMQKSCIRSHKGGNQKPCPKR